MSGNSSINILPGAIIKDFVSREWILQNKHHINCEKLKVPNPFFQYPSCGGNKKKYTDDELKEHRKKYLTKYNQTNKAKELSRERSKRYRDKKKIQIYDQEHDFNLKEQLNKKPSKSILKIK